MPFQAVLATELLTVEIGDGGGPETFAHPASINQSRSLKFSADVAVRKVPNTNQSLPMKTTRQVVATDSTVSGAGKMAPADFKAWADWMRAGTAKNCKIRNGVTGGLLVTGAYVQPVLGPRNLPMHPMVLRTAAAQAAVDRFNGCALAWSTNDCGRLAAFTLRRLGYRPPMPKAGSYRTPAGALKWLRANGLESLEAALDAVGLPRIAPAEALPGDVVAMPSDDGWVALAVALGNGRLLGFLDRGDGVPVCGVVEPTFKEGFAPICAWRADPCPR